MKEMLIKRLGNLLTIKSLVTIIFVLLFAYTVVAKIENETLKTLLTMVVGFYFGTQVTKE